jgi:hypothetical protein
MQLLDGPLERLVWAPSQLPLACRGPRLCSPAAAVLARPLRLQLRQQRGDAGGAASGWGAARLGGQHAVAPAVLSTRCAKRQRGRALLQATLPGVLPLHQ